ncbi:helicase, partial [Prevotella copri]|nr:helicase [Segatella copri]
METKSNLKSSMMAGNQSAIYQVESFLEEFYLFRRNVLNGKTEFFCIKPKEEKELEKKEETLKEESPEEKNWKVLTAEAFNSIVRCAKKLGIGEKKSPRQDIE